MMYSVRNMESQDSLQCPSTLHQPRHRLLPFLAGCLCLSAVTVGILRWAVWQSLWAEPTLQPALTHRLPSRSTTVLWGAAIAAHRTQVVSSALQPIAFPEGAATTLLPRSFTLDSSQSSGLGLGLAAVGLVAAGVAAMGIVLRSRRISAEDHTLEFAVFMLVQGQPINAVLVTGATGRTGSLVVKALLQKSPTVKVRAFVRDRQKAAEVLPQSDRVEVMQGDLGDEQKVKAACDGVDAVIWCATGFSSNTSPWQTLLNLFGMKVLKRPLDSVALKVIGEAMKLPEGQAATHPKVVMCSSSAVTRPTWPEEKRQRLVGAADIPIVRLNPFGVLDIKRESEQVLRDTGVSYTIVRPTGLNAQVESGRPILSQGDVAVGRISRADVAELLVRLLLEEAGCISKTFEVLALPGLPAPRSYAAQLARLQPDSEPLAEAVVQAHYHLLQQLLPGEALEADRLAMGQTYEQLDRGETGRLGKRGEESVPGSQAFGGQ